MIQVSAVPYEYASAVWPHVEKFLRPAAKLQGVFRVEDIKEMLDRRDIALWVMIDDTNGMPVAAATTRLIEYPTRRAMAIDWVGGKRMKEWLPQLSDLMDKYAKDNGCEHIEGMGRHGWLRALAGYGYRKWYPMYRKELTNV